MSAALFSYDLDPEGRRKFVARERIAPEPPLCGAFGDDDEGRDGLVQWVLERFTEDVRAKMPQMEEMRQAQLYYDGKHWATPEDNRRNAVTNVVFSIIETVHPTLTEVAPRPEIVPGLLFGDTAQADALQEYATNLMDRIEWDEAVSLNVREMLKYGWAVFLIVTRPETGVAYSVPISAWDFYPDASAHGDDDLERYTIARPVPTDWLRAQFPALAAQIVPDGLASPSYEVFERANQEYYQRDPLFDFPEGLTAAIARLETTPDSGGTTTLVPADVLSERTNARTTFLIQMFVRDRTTVRATYTGDEAIYDDDAKAYNYAATAHIHEADEPCCPSGWRVVQITANGLLLDSEPLDECYLGRNVEILRDYSQLGLFYGTSEARNVIPLNRRLNARKTAIDVSLGYETLPIALIDEGAGTDVDRKGIAPGDELRVQRGSTIRWLDYKGPGNAVYAMLQQDLQDIDLVSGVQDSSRGRRPEGIEAAAAVRELKDSEQTRVRGKEGPMFSCLARVLRKVMYATGKKSKYGDVYRASNGALVSIDPELLVKQYSIRFARGSGTAIGRAQGEEKVMGMFQAGLLDPQTTLERLGTKGIPGILARLTSLAPPPQAVGK